MGVHVLNAIFCDDNNMPFLIQNKKEFLKEEQWYNPSTKDKGLGELS